jgi:hypothetical protein
LAAPSALVESDLSFDKNPRLANGRGFFYAPAAASHNCNEYEQDN